MTNSSSLLSSAQLWRACKGLEATPRQCNQRAKAGQKEHNLPTARELRAPGGKSTLSQSPGKHSSRSSRAREPEAVSNSESLCSRNAEPWYATRFKTTMVAVPLLLEKEGSLRSPPLKSSLCLQFHLHASISHPPYVTTLRDSR